MDNLPNDYPSESSDQPGQASGHYGDSIAQKFFEHSSAQRTNTDALIVSTIKKIYPNLELVITPAMFCDLLGYARAGFATYTPVDNNVGNTPASLQWTQYIPPTRRLDGALGGLGQRDLFGKYLYRWRDTEFVVYVVDGRDGTAYYPNVLNYYILGPSKQVAESLILSAGRWGADLHDEVWVFDGGMWQKSRELFESVRGASWDAVILDEGMKRDIIDDHLDFFGSRETYRQLRVPWKRGIIYYGPPGNGKTISIKAMMHTLYNLDPAVPTLYVRTLVSYGGPEFALRQIFSKAREFAPCYLVFEDLDSIVSDNVRSYFLNEVDGLKSNDGIFMVGSTNHLDRLDPGISKRPSRFDRKYYFPDPNLKERTAYCHFWQKKLAGNKDIEFPDKLCGAIARITDGFSFAYMQEAFVAALLAIARGKKKKDHAHGSEGRTEEPVELADGWVDIVSAEGSHDKDLDDFILWVEIQKQIAILREGMERKD
ncbi:P-loop containing nucleoside triphosphate hydrolase protein [Xylariales sp. PMI_506]|nr:P-loop containing nucleoside triphosphate hydrolase protein [Xylariales sp. PMI_506]